LLTKEHWLDNMDGNGPVETICATVEDYSNDFSLLQQDYLFYLLIELERLVTVEYIKPRLYRNKQNKSHPNYPSGN